MSRHSDLSAFIGRVRNRYITLHARTMTTDDMTIADVILDDPARFMDGLKKCGIVNAVDLRAFGPPPPPGYDEPMLAYVVIKDGPVQIEQAAVDAHGKAAADQIMFNGTHPTPWSDFVDRILDAYERNRH